MKSFFQELRSYPLTKVWFALGLIAFTIHTVGVALGLSDAKLEVFFLPAVAAYWDQRRRATGA